MTVVMLRATGPTLSELTDHWITSRSYAAESARQRRSILRGFADVVGDTQPELLDHFDILRWWSTTEGLSPASRRSYHSAVAGFLRWCRSMGLDAPTTLEEVRKPTVPRRTPKVLTDDQECALRAEVSGEPIELAVALMLDMGLRRSEAARVTVEDIEGDWLSVRGKGGHRDRLPLHPNVARLLPDSGPLVPWSSCHMAQLVVTAMRSVGIEGLTCHALRRTFATRLMERGTSAVDVMRLLRHRSLATTTAYVASRFDRAA